jgi:hypothetical protein
VCFCKFASLHVYKKFRIRKLQINNYNFTNCKCTIASAHLQICASLQIYKIKNSIKLKNILITILQIAD